MNQLRGLFCRLVLGVSLLWIGCGSALAAITINQILVNDGATANVAPGARISVKVTVSIDGGTRWRSTQFTTSPASAAINFCSVSPDYSLAGTYTVEFFMDAPTAQNVYSLTVRADAQPSCNGNQGSNTVTAPNAINTAPATVTLNHVRIVHDGTGLNCSPETVTLRACADASCASPFTQSVSVTLPAALGTWSANPVTFTGGQTTVQLSRSTGGTAVLSGSVTSPAATNTALVCYRGSTANDCNLQFGETACQLDAVEVGTGPNTPIFTRRADAPVVLDVLTLVNGVLTSNRAGDVTATLVDGSSGTCGTTALSAPVVLRYNSSNLGRRTFTFTPTAASPNARVKLVSGSLEQCSSDNFAIRPAALTVSSTNANQDATGASVTTGSPLKAGSTPFTLSAAGHPGYSGRPVVAADRLVAAEVAAAAPGIRGVLSGTFTGGSGTATGAAFRYSEVGYFKFLSYGVYDDGTFTDVDGVKGECYQDLNLGTGTAPADPNVVNASGKIGCYFGNAETGFFGRFVPDRFAMVTPASFINRSALSSCVAPGFSYAGEGMSVSIPLEAQNGGGTTTRNYTGRFNRFTPASQMGYAAINDPPAPATRLPFPACNASAAHPCLQVGTVTGNFVEGKAVIANPLTVLRSAAASGPFEHMKITMAPVDADSVAMASYDVDSVNVTPGVPNHTTLAGTRIRYGRLNIDNAYGSELLNLTLRVNAQYWNGSAWLTNSLDSCTPTSAAGFAMDTYSGGISAANMNTANILGGGVLTAGAGRIVLSKPIPTPGTKGSVLVRSATSYLPGTARATFGVYKAGPVIYMRETY